MTTAVMSQPQNREASEPNNFCKLGPSCDFKIDPLPLVSAKFCWCAGEQDPTFSFSAFQAPLFSFVLPVSNQCLWRQPHHPMENLRVTHIAKKNPKVNFSLKPRKVINPQIPLPLPLTAPSCHTHPVLSSLCMENGDLEKKKKKKTESWGHTIITFLFQCFLLLPAIITLLFLYLAS